jgi:hypothetical protein
MRPTSITTVPQMIRASPPMTDTEVRGGASSEHRTAHDRKNPEHVQACETCKRVQSMLRTFKDSRRIADTPRDEDGRLDPGNWSADLLSPTHQSRVPR